MPVADEARVAAGGAFGGRLAIEHADRKAALGKFMGRAEPDDAGADDEDIRSGGAHEARARGPEFLQRDAFIGTPEVGTRAAKVPRAPSRCAASATLL